MAKVTNFDELKKLQAERLKACRKKLNLTQEQVIEKIQDLPENKGKIRNEKHLSNIERGTRTISREYAYLLGKVLGVSPGYLLGEEDFETENARFAHTIATMKHEGSLLYTGLCAFAELNSYKIVAPKLRNTGSIENYFREVRAGYKITKDNQTISLSPEEMNRFENEVCDFVELKLKHLFKQKGVKIDG